MYWKTVEMFENDSFCGIFEDIIVMSQCLTSTVNKILSGWWLASLPLNKNYFELTSQTCHD